MDFLPEIDDGKCIACELCVQHCPTGALSMAGRVARISAPDRCVYSGVCEEICPTEAISLTYEIVSSGDDSSGRE
jgi:formate hydrogenlyase subunit 6/NADH:ubiquinone oxidoreductase subunit I